MPEGFKTTGAFQEDFKCLCYLTAIAASQGRIPDSQELISQILKILENPEYQIMAVSIMRLAGSFLVERIESIGEMQFSRRIRDEMDQFEKRLSALRSLVAAHAVSLPLTSRRISIRCMGKTQVKMAGKAITRKSWQTQIARDILIYLSLHPGGAKKELICEIFWPNTSQKDMNMRFKNTMYRIRRAVGKEIILYDDSVYSFNFSLDCEIDAILFRDTIDAAKQSRNAEEKYKLFEEAIRMYHGDFLNDVDYEWAILEREHFRRLYIDTLITLSEYYYKIRKFELAQSYAQNAIKAEPGNEAGHQLAMKIYAGMKNKPGIVKQFEKYKKITVDHLGNEISAETRRLFDELSQ